MNTLSHEQALETLSLVPALFCHTDSDGRFLWLGGHWGKALGHPRDTLAALSLLDLVHPEDQANTRQTLLGLAPGSSLSDFEVRMRHAEGHYEWVRWSSHATHTHLASVGQVVTSERHQRQRLMEQTELLRLSEKLAQVGHWRVDLATEKLTWSEEVFRIHGLDPDEPQPDVATGVGFYHPDDAGLVDAYVKESIEKGTPFDFELRLIRLDGMERIVRSRGQVEYDLGGAPVTLLGTFQDITEARMMQQRLQDGERLASVSLLAAGIAHEINNPLQYVFANIGLAQEQLESLSQGGHSPWARRINELLDDAMHGSKQVARIVGDLKSFMSQPQTGSRLVDLNEVIKTTISMTRSEVRHRAQLAESMGPVPKVTADYSELIQVFINLLTNAADAVEPLGPERARIRLSCATDAHGWAVIEVEDNGPGVPSGDHVRIFEPFYTTKPTGEGSGLGLHISRGIIERRGGSLTLSSTPGLTVFRVRLPPAKTSERTDKPPSTALRILIVDDDPRVARTIARMLSDEYTCVVETDPRVALEYLVEHRPDAVISDVMMPGMTGWELLALAELQAPGTTARGLLMSGGHPDRCRPADASEVPVLGKPFAPKELRDALRTILERE